MGAVSAVLAAAEAAGAGEILAHRIMWSLVAVVAVLAVRRSRGWLRTLGWRRGVLLALAALVISVNWGTYIYAVNSGHTIESALGYFINPLISVVFGVVIFRERLRPWQWAAVGLGAAAVVALTVGYGRPPWIALVLAGAFAVYGLLKKFAGMPSAESLAVETAVTFLRRWASCCCWKDGARRPSGTTVRGTRCCWPGPGS
ncbi:EamA family transporter [Actinomadura luteofluorescens]|uniref:EamA family transporter n=1 Tax=Actinomadura luteofluorescens TaxID=46163 RepID=UPI003644E2FB